MVFVVGRNGVRVTQPSNNKGLGRIPRPLKFVARPAGFEPTTPWFVARYSIHLSYGRFEEVEL